MVENIPDHSQKITVMFRTFIKKNTLLNDYFSIGCYTLPVVPVFYETVQQVIHYRNIVNTQSLLTGARLRFLFRKNGWQKRPFFTNNTAFNAVVVISGSAVVRLGGMGGCVKTAKAGDVIIIPPGVNYESRKTGTNFYRAHFYTSVTMSEILRSVPLDPVFGVWGEMQKLWVSDY
jgi:uncharacterized protein YjlB